MTHETRGPWRVHSTQVEYENPWLRVESSKITHPDGTPGIYGVVYIANLATGVLPIDAEGYTWLVGQHRYPANTYSWELPEGGGQKGVDPWVSASRELKEETGLIAASHCCVGEWELSNSVTDEVAFGYLAWDLTEGPSSPEPSEDLTVVRLPFADLLARMRAGEIRDAFTHLIVNGAIDQARQGRLPAPISDILLSA
ncbi:MAG: NUDIX hydrolase [Pseudomonadota bacterium]